MFLRDHQSPVTFTEGEIKAALEAWVNQHLMPGTKLVATSIRTTKGAATLWFKPQPK